METGENFYFAHAMMVLIASVLATLAGSRIILRRYRVAVKKGMDQTLGMSLANKEIEPLHGLKHAARLVKNEPNWSSIVASAERHAQRQARVYSLAAILFSLVAASVVGFLEDLTIKQIAFFTFVFTWPLYPTLRAIIPHHFVARWGFPGFYIIGLVIIGMQTNSVKDVLLMLIPIMVLPASLALVIFRRSVRSVGPLIFAFSFIVLYALGVVLWYVGQAILGGLGLWFSVIMLLGAALLVGKTSLSATHRIGQWYQQKKISQTMLDITGWWLSFSFVLVMIYSSTSGYRSLMLLLAWVVFISIIRLGFVIIVNHYPKIQPVNLLLLRVFKNPDVAETLFEPLERYWLNIGPVHMIAGADLATSGAEPDEILNYLSGKLDNKFLNTEADIGRNITALDESPDPDGRFRVNEVFCNNDTWQRAFISLAKRSNLVLFDLRGFSPKNEGVKFELNYVFNSIPFKRILFLIGPTTNTDHLQTTFRSLLNQVRSPNINTNLDLSDLQVINDKKELREMVLEFAG